MREIGDEITVFDWGEENNFYFELSGVSKGWGFKKMEYRLMLFLLQDWELLVM